MESGASAAASSSAAPHVLGGGGDVAPSQTLYVQNLTEKVKKAPLKKSLFVAFSPFGRVVDVVHCRSNALRGQAWVVFDSVASATAAMAKLQSFPLFDKPMVRGAASSTCPSHGMPCALGPRLALPCLPSPNHPPLLPPTTPTTPTSFQRISFAKERSHAIEKLEGTYKPGMKRSAENRGAGGGGGGAGAKGAKRARTGEAPEEAAAAEAAAAAAAAAAGAGGGMQHPFHAAPPPMPQQPALPLLALPSKTLLVQGLPTSLAPEALTEMLRALFGQYAGLAEVRVVAQRGLAFVEYQSEAAAAPALQGLMNFKLDATTSLTVTYAKAF